METFVPVVKYIFVVATGVELALILRALFRLAVDKARMAQTTIAVAEE